MTPKPDNLLLDRFTDRVARGGHRDTLVARFTRLQRALPVAARVLQLNDDYGVTVLRELLGMGEAPLDEVVRYPELATPFFQRGWVERPFRDNPPPLPNLARCKRHIWLKILLRERLDHSSLEDTLSDLTELADRVTREAFTILPDGLAVWAMGKWGGGELNASSDIDPILFRSDALEPEEADRAVREWLKRLMPPGEPEVYPVDLRLRPEGDNGPLVFRYAKLEEYLMRRAAPWERIAYLRARKVFGDEPAWIHDLLNAFLFPPGTDPEQRLRETAGMLHAIHQNAAGNDLKRAPGGIRDVEFLVAGLQLAFGRQITSIRTGTVLELLAQMTKEGLLKQDRAHALSEGYRLLRTVENALQTDADRPVFTLPVHGSPAATQLAWGLGTTVELLYAQVQQARRRIAELVHEELALDTAQAGGYSDPQAEGDSKRSGGRVEALKRRFAGPWGTVDTLLDTSLLAEAPDPEAVYSRLENALHSVGGATVWREGMAKHATLFHELSRILVYGALLCDEAQSFPGYWERYGRRPPSLPEKADKGRVEQTLGEILFQLGGAFLNGRQDALETVAAWSEAVDEAVWLFHRDAPSSTGMGRVGLVALGKWGGCELAPYGDLDLLLVAEDMPAEELAELQRQAALWLDRCADGGKLLMDPRLRPEGSGSPMVVTLTRLEDYITNRAASWEKLAWSRARAVGAQTKLAVRATALLAEFIQTPPRDSEWPAIHRARKRAATVKRPSPDRILLKKGRGGMMDFEFATVFAYWREEIPYTDWKPSLPERFAHLAALTGDDAWTRAIDAYHTLRDWELRLVLAGKRGRGELVLKGEQGRETEFILGVSIDEIRSYWKEISSLGKQLYEEYSK